jgi:hypothetical protein
VIAHITLSEQPRIGSVRRSIAAVIVVLFTATAASADIYQWEWVNPADHNQGMRQSNIVCAGGAGVSAAPGANLAGLDLTNAYLDSADLTAADLTRTNLTGSFLQNVNLSRAVLSGTNLSSAQLLGIDITNADLRGANLAWASLYPLSLDNADFTNVDATHSDWLVGDSVGKANLAGARMSGAVFTLLFGGKWLDVASFGSKDWRGSKRGYTRGDQSSRPRSCISCFVRQLQMKTTASSPREV